MPYVAVNSRWRTPGRMQTRVESVTLEEGLQLKRADHKGEDDDRNAFLIDAVRGGNTVAALNLGSRFYWVSTRIRSPGYLYVSCTSA